MHYPSEKNHSPYSNKIFLLFIVCILGFPSPTTAQLFRAEITGGVAGSQISGDELSGFNKAGIYAGLGVRTSLNKEFELGFRIVYFQKGSRQRLKSDEPDSSFYLLRLNYMEVPLTLRYSLSKSFYMEAGPSFGYLIKSSEQDEQGELNFRRPFSKFDLSITGCFGYTITEKLDFNLGYYQSIVPIREHASGAIYRLNQGQYSSVLTFTLLYTFKSNREEKPSEEK
ncbi:MAG: PorT family protein [Bacteroidetes bacterium]|nr:PorT family protein [Bacteroidota bacterium]